jgi:hypothetical protein
MYRSTAAMLIAAQLLTVGCTSYVRMDPTAIPRDADIRIDLAAPGSVAARTQYDSIRVEGVTRLLGRFDQASGDTVVLGYAVLSGRRLPGQSRGVLREARYVRQSDDVVSQRRFSIGRTVAAVLAPIAILGILYAASDPVYSISSSSQ